MKFVPTVTGRVRFFDYSGIDEILISPNATDILPNVSSIIIDNHGFYLNTPAFVKSKERIYEVFYRHIEVCKNLTSDNLIFILPDIKLIPEFRHKAIEIFMQEINPKRYCLVDQYDFDKDFPDLYQTSEFLAIPYKKFHERTHNDPSRYHLLSGIKGQMPTARSWDSTKFEGRILKDVVKEYSEKHICQSIS